MRMPENGRMCTGLTALGVWAEEMQQEQYFPVGNDQVLMDRYISTTISMTQLRDHDSAAPFLRQVAAEEPNLAPELDQAIACFSESSRLREQLNDLIADDFSVQAIKAIGDPDRRRAFASIILKIRAKEEEATPVLERLLAASGLEAVMRGPAL